MIVIYFVIQQNLFDISVFFRFFSSRINGWCRCLRELSRHSFSSMKRIWILFFHVSLMSCHFTKNDSNTSVLNLELHSFEMFVTTQIEFTKMQ